MLCTTMCSMSLLLCPWVLLDLALEPLLEVDEADGYVYPILELRRND